MPHPIGRRTFLQGAALSAKRASRPNFLFLIADDLTFRGVRALGNAEVETPAIDGLMRRGCTFTHCFHQGSWSGAVCVPSRTMLNSGLSAFRARDRFEQSPLWGETFRKAAYDTYLTGKWHLSTPALERSFTERNVVAPGMYESGPDAYGRPREGNTWTPWDRQLKGQWMADSHGAIRHSAEIFADSTIAQIDKATRAGRPFLIYTGFTSPHDPRQAPREYVERYPASRLAVPPNYLPQHPFDQGDMRIRDEQLAPFPRTRAAVQLHRSEYYAHTTFMDAQIGRILAALERSGKARETYVIFTADHGLAVGEHGLMGKQNLYDHSVRMPYVIAGPGIPAARRVDALVYQHSTFATTCELAGLATPPTVEFPSLARLAQGRSDAHPHEAVFCWYRDYQRSIRTRDHKLIVYPEAKVTQLFDLQKDPWEIQNQAENPAYQTTRANLKSRLARLRQDLGDTASHF